MTTTFTVTEVALNKLDIAEANVRRTGQGNGIEELAASIAAHGLLQSLVVRPKLDGSGEPTGRYGVVAGGRRFAALKLLAKRKAFGKAGPVPCRVLHGEDAGEVSLAENVVRLDMHPADQFEAFARLHQEGQRMGIEDIAARFGVSADTVRQRLRPLPGEHAELWGWLQNHDMPALLTLLAVCVARCANAGGADWTEGRGAGCVAAQVARAAGLDMGTWWQPTAESYLGRVPKALILDAVRDAAGPSAAARIEGMKKETMAANAAELLDGTDGCRVCCGCPMLSAAPRPRETTINPEPPSCRPRSKLQTIGSLHSGAALPPVTTGGGAQPRRPVRASGKLSQ